MGTVRARAGATRSQDKYLHVDRNTSAQIGVQTDGVIGPGSNSCHCLGMSRNGDKDRADDSGRDRDKEGDRDWDRLQKEASGLEPCSACIREEWEGRPCPGTP